MAAAVAGALLLLWLATSLCRSAASATDERAEYTRHALAVPGDAQRGRVVFANVEGAGCIRCHRVGKEGGDVGPALSDIGGKYGREHLIEAVLEPSRQIVEGYRPTMIATVEGRLLTGSGPGRDGRGADPLGQPGPLAGRPQVR